MYHTFHKALWQFLWEVCFLTVNLPCCDCHPCMVAQGDCHSCMIAMVYSGGWWIVYLVIYAFNLFSFLQHHVGLTDLQLRWVIKMKPICWWGVSCLPAGHWEAPHCALSSLPVHRHKIVLLLFVLNTSMATKPKFPSFTFVHGSDYYYNLNA